MESRLDWIELLRLLVPSLVRILTSPVAAIEFLDAVGQQVERADVFAEQFDVIVGGFAHLLRVRGVEFGEFLVLGIDLPPLENVGYRERAGEHAEHAARRHIPHAVERVDRAQQHGKAKQQEELKRH